MTYLKPRLECGCNLVWPILVLHHRVPLVREDARSDGLIGAIEKELNFDGVLFVTHLVRVLVAPAQGLVLVRWTLQYLIHLYGLCWFVWLLHWGDSALLVCFDRLTLDRLVDSLLYCALLYLSWQETLTTN